MRSSTGDAEKRVNKEIKQTLLNDDAGGGHLDNRQRRARVINGDAAGCSGGWRRAGATHGTGVAEALGTVLLRAVEEAQVELTAGVERHFRREGVRRRGAAQTRAQRLIDFENVHFTGERNERMTVPANGVRHVALVVVLSAVSIRVDPSTWAARCFDPFCCPARESARCRRGARSFCFSSRA